MKRVVVDTSVLVAALRSDGGASRAVVRRCLEGAIEPQIGAALFGEIEDVFRRAEPFARSATTEAERDTVLDAFFARCRWVRVSYLWRPNLRDKADNHLIELAVASGAGAIITHNGRDLNSGELRFPNLIILTPTEALRGFNQEAKPWPR